MNQDMKDAHKMNQERLAFSDFKRAVENLYRDIDKVEGVYKRISDALNSTLANIAVKETATHVKASAQLGINRTTLRTYLKIQESQS